MALDDGRVVSNLIRQAILNKPLTIYGDGTQTRSFCFVSDLIEGLLSLFFAEKVFTPVNLGNPTPISMLELAQVIRDLTQSNSEIIFHKLPEDDPLIREPDISLASSRIGWSPSVDLKKGLLQTIEYFKHEIRNLTNYHNQEPSIREGN
jgi:UDP-glucuronate decarboxylase